jgi:glutathione S-transferase
MYKPMDIGVRAGRIAEIDSFLTTLERLCVGPCMIGPHLSAADVALFPHVAFMTEILPRYFGWKDIFHGRPKLAKWWAMVQSDPVMAKVRWCHLGVL